jgi:hypothetical protein
MATCAVMGQAMGTAAALCSKYDLMPRKLYENKPRLTELKQTLLRDDQSIKNLKNDDPLDVARTAKVTASAVAEGSQPANVLSGLTRDMASQLTNRWLAPLSADGAWLELTWDKPQKLSMVQLVLDTGFHRELTLTSAASHQKGQVRAPQPETLRDYQVVIRTPDNKLVPVADIKGNHQRLRRHYFNPVEATAVRIEATASNGGETARIYEVRCYA